MAFVCCEDSKFGKNTMDDGASGYRPQVWLDAMEESFYWKSRFGTWTFLLALSAISCRNGK